MDVGKLARRLLLLRSWERQHMPMAGSIIAGDIVLGFNRPALQAALEKNELLPKAA